MGRREPRESRVDVPQSGLHVHPDLEQRGGDVVRPVLVPVDRREVRQHPQGAPGPDCGDPRRGVRQGPRAGRHTHRQAGGRLANGREGRGQRVRLEGVRAVVVLHVQVHRTGAHRRDRRDVPRQLHRRHRQRRMLVATTGSVDAGLQHPTSLPGSGDGADHEDR
jgi:hypothetical protein